MSGHVNCASCPHYWCPKMLREKLCAQSTHIPVTGTVLEQRTREAFAALIEVLDKHRPLGSDGKHGARHTRTCGCDLT